jgi:PmbA protein
MEKAATDAVDRATRLLGATKARSTNLTVVLDPRVTTVVLGVLSSALSGEAVLKGRSLFAGRLGEQVGASVLTLVDDPTDALAYGAATHDAEGLACRRNELVRDGVLSRFVYDSYAGRRAGTASTGSAVRGGFKTAPGVGCRALSLVPGTASQEEIVASVGEGMLVQWVTGIHSGVNPISGDFSVGAEGMMIRDGALAEPVREVTIASTLQRMLTHVVALGADLEWLPGVAAGLTLAIGEVSLSGA